MIAIKIFTASLVAVLAMGLSAPVAGAQEQALCVTAARANLRAGPGKNFRINWEVNRYMPLVPVDRKGKWLKVKDVRNPGRGRRGLRHHQQGQSQYPQESIGPLAETVHRGEVYFIQAGGR